MAPFRIYNLNMDLVLNLYDLNPFTYIHSVLLDGHHIVLENPCL